MIDQTFGQLVNLEQIEQLLKSHNRLSGMAYGLFDADENNLIAVGWQDICVRFHRANPVTCAYCRESDAFIKAHLHDAKGEPLEYRCKNNMIDIAMPIVIEGWHLGTFFTGQFFYDDDPPDREFFFAQAKALDFDTAAYLEALDRVPIFSRDHVRGNVLFLYGMVQILAETGLKNLRLAREMEERKRAEEEIRQLSLFQRTILNSAAYSIISATPDGIVTGFNPAAERLLGYAADEVVGKQTPALWHDSHEVEQYALQLSDVLGEDIQPGFDVFTARPKRNLPEENEWAFIRKNGTRVPANLSVTALRDEGGSITGFVGLIYDLTERKRAEDELKRYRDSLEETVEQRTAELRLALDSAEAANKAKSTFLANMSHELRTPLNAILGFSSMMRRNPRVTDTEAESLDIINRSGEHLLALINDVLEVAKIEAGRLKLDIVPFDLGGMARDVADMMRLRAQEKGLQLLLDQSSEFPRYIRGDKARLRQILVNLVGNAVKFTVTGGIVIRLGVKQNDRQHLLIEVEDSGPGISLEDQERIFRPFVQLAEGAEQEGTGLGLTITKQFVELIGGRIAVESTLGKGSLFRVDVPVELADAADIPAMKGEEAGEVVGLAPGQPAYRILIAEDQLENALLLSRLMSDIGLETKVAENGEKCVQLFQEWHPDLIWMDRRMPVIDGLEAARRIRRLPDGGKVKIVAVTASAFKEQQTEMLAVGMDDFVRKPYRFGEIYDSLARQLGLKYVYRSEIAAAQVTPGAPIRVLIVDDDNDSRFLTRDLLRKSSFMLREVASGPEALHVFGEWQPHLILMDMRMPGMDGMETTRRLRTLPGGDKILIVALTAGALDEQRAEFIAAGCNEVAIKPVDLNKVRKLLAQYLGSQGADTAPVRQLRSDDLPEPLRQQLLDAAIRLDGKAIAAVCASLDARQPEVAAAIRVLADNFRYDELVRRLEGSMPDGSIAMGGHHAAVSP